MTSEGTGLIRARPSARRVAAMAVAIGCHAALLVAMLRPATFEPDTPSPIDTRASALALRLIPRPQVRPSRAETPVHRAVSKGHTAPHPAPRTVLDAGPQPAPPSPEPSPQRPPAPDHGTNDSVSISDGGFQERLLNAQNAGHLRGVPGSDRRIAPGIRLINPMNQGVDAVMRSTQRLFGVTSSHCVDAEVWEHLTPEERIARHISAADIKAMNDKYECNRPKGLNF